MTNFSQKSFVSVEIIFSGQKFVKIRPERREREREIKKCRAKPQGDDTPRIRGPQQGYHGSQVYCPLS